MDGPSLLLTRPRAQSLEFAGLCRAAGFAGHIEISPVLRIVPCRPGLAPAANTTLIFTSTNAVAAASQQGIATRAPAWAVGDRTARAARDAGLSCRSADGTVEDLLRALLSERPAGPLLHLRGAHSQGDLAKRLRDAGLDAAETVVYDQSACDLTASAMDLLRGPGAVILPIFSPRSARLILAGIGDPPASLTVIAISPAVAAQWIRPERAIVAASPDARSMVAAIMGNRIA